MEYIKNIHHSTSKAHLPNTSNTSSPFRGEVWDGSGFLSDVSEAAKRNELSPLQLALNNRATGAFIIPGSPRARLLAEYDAAQGRHAE